MGKWTCTDPKEQFHSGYMYTNDPLTMVDPNGEAAIKSRYLDFGGALGLTGEKLAGNNVYGVALGYGNIARHDQIFFDSPQFLESLKGKYFNVGFFAIDGANILDLVRDKSVSAEFRLEKPLQAAKYDKWLDLPELEDAYVAEAIDAAILMTLRPRFTHVTLPYPCHKNVSLAHSWHQTVSITHDKNRMP